MTLWILILTQLTCDLLGAVGSVYFHVSLEDGIDAGLFAWCAGAGLYLLYDRYIRRD